MTEKDSKAEQDFREYVQSFLDGKEASAKVPDQLVSLAEVDDTVVFKPRSDLTVKVPRGNLLEPIPTGDEEVRRLVETGEVFGSEMFMETVRPNPVSIGDGPLLAEKAKHVSASNEDGFELTVRFQPNRKTDAYLEEGRLKAVQDVIRAAFDLGDFKIESFLLTILGAQPPEKVSHDELLLSAQPTEEEVEAILRANHEIASRLQTEGLDPISAIKVEGAALSKEDESLVDDKYQLDPSRIFHETQKLFRRKP